MSPEETSLPELEAGHHERRRSPKVSTSFGKLPLHGEHIRDLRIYSGLMAKDSDFWIFQRFDHLQLFNILIIEQRLLSLEQHLDSVLDLGIQHAGGLGHNYVIDSGKLEALISQIQPLLKEYDQALIAQARHKEFKAPNAKLLDGLKKICHNEGYGSHVNSRLDCSKNDPKLAAIAASEKRWIHKLVDTSTFLQKMFKIRGLEKNEEMQPKILLYSESRIRKLEIVIFNLGFCILVLGPVFALSYVQERTWKLLIVLLFLLLASAFTTDTSDNKTNVAAMAGYAAVLVVFLASEEKS